MTRFGRIVLNGGTLLLLVLFVATAVLWVRSNWVSEAWYWSNGRVTARVASWQCSVSFYQSRLSGNVPPAGWRYEWSEAEAGRAWGYFRVYGRGPVLVMLPCWAVCAVTALPLGGRLVARRVRDRRRRRRLARLVCAECGYDLRATPERCPECGLIPS